MTQELANIYEHMPDTPAFTCHYCCVIQYARICIYSMYILITIKHVYIYIYIELMARSYTPSHTLSYA